MKYREIYKANVANLVTVDVIQQARGDHCQLGNGTIPRG